MAQFDELVVFPGCEDLSVVSDGVWLKVCDWDAADTLLRSHFNFLSRMAGEMGKKETRIYYDSSKKPLRIRASQEKKKGERQVSIENMTNAEIEQIAGASFLAIHEKMKEWRSEGLIVTVTDMMTNHCLHVNDLQAPDRGGGWKGRDWIGLNFLTLWRDSFMSGKFNYFEQLITTVQKDLHIPQFEYNLRAPSGDLRRYVSDYYFVESYLDTPVRICVSKPQNWEVVEAATP